MGAILNLCAAQTGTSQARGFAVLAVKRFSYRDYVTCEWREPLSAEILRIHPDEPEPDRMQYIVSCLRSGKVVGMPTDTFYGLAVDPVNLRAVESIYEIKSRLKHKPLSLLIADVSQATSWRATWAASFDKLAERFWPGPLTIIVSAGSRAAAAHHGQHRQRGAARAGCGDSARGGGGLRAADHGDLGEPGGHAGVHQRGMRARPDRRPNSADRGWRPDRRGVPTTIVDLSERRGRRGRFCARARFRRTRLRWRCTLELDLKQ